MTVYQSDDLTLRDYFAVEALNGLLSIDSDVTIDEHAKDAYRVADAMLAARAVEPVVVVKSDELVKALKDVILVDGREESQQPVECSGTCGVALAGVNPESIHLLVNALLGFIDWEDRNTACIEQPPRELFLAAERAIAESRKGV